MTKKLDKNDIKGPDAFVSFSDQVFQWLEKNAKIIGVSMVVAVVATVSYIGFEYFQGQKEMAAAEALFKPEAELRNAQKQPPGKVADFNKDFAPSVEKVKAQIKQHSGTKSGAISAMNLAAFLLQQKQYEQALEVLNISTYTPGSKDMLAGFWHMHKGLALLENKKYKDSVAAYQNILNSADLKFFHPEAMLKQGLAYDLEGNAQKARETYEKVGRDFPNTEASNAAQQYLRLLDIKS